MIFSRHIRCNGACQKSGSRECYNCFSTNPQCSEPTQIAACVDFLQKRRPPVLHEIDTITPGNIRRICIVREHLRKSGMLSVGDAERLFAPSRLDRTLYVVPCVSEEPCRKTQPYACDESLRRYNQIEEGISKWRTGFGASIPAACTSWGDMWKMAQGKLQTVFLRKRFMQMNGSVAHLPKLRPVLALQTRKAMSKAAFVVTSDSHPDRPKPLKLATIDQALSENNPNLRPKIPAAKEATMICNSMPMKQTI